MSHRYIDGGNRYCAQCQPLVQRDRHAQETDRLEYGNQRFDDGLIWGGAAVGLLAGIGWILGVIL